MLSNYFKTAWRNLTRNKLYSVINIAGLAAGMAVTMLIAFWVTDELSFDHYHSNHKRLAQLMRTSAGNDGTLFTEAASCIPVANELRSKYGTDFKNVALTSWNFGHVLAVGDKRILASGLWAEAAFPSMFSLKTLKGTLGGLDDPSSVLLSASLARTLFGSEAPVGQTIRFDNKEDYKVTGVFEDLPQNTTLHETKLLLPWKKYITAADWIQKATTSWNDQSFQVFTELAGQADINRVSEKIRNVVMDHVDIADGKEQASLFPMDRWHLYSEFKNGQSVGGYIQFVQLFSIVGVFVLLLACINFMNLSTARSEQRAREVGVRKTIGSLRGQLIRQFLGESVFTAFLAFLLALLLVLFLMPFFNKLADKAITFPWKSGLFWILSATFILITGFISGLYPAFYLSKFKPVKVLKGTFRVGSAAALPRKVLVVVQFTFSIALIIGSLIVFKQIRYAKDRPVNYQKEGLMTVQMNTSDLSGHYDALRQDLLATGAVANMAESSSPTIDIFSYNSEFDWPGKDPKRVLTFGIIGVTADFGKTIGWQMVAGRDFSKEFTTDTSAVILNEAAVKLMGNANNIVGKTIRRNNKEYTVVGIIKNMITTSPYAPPVPSVYINDPNWANVVTVALKPGAPVNSALQKVAAVFKKYNPNAPFDYEFNDQTYARKFAAEQRIGSLAGFFTLLAVFISCLGLFGLSAFIAEQRKKEIGVRKVLGAGVYNLWELLSKEFIALVLISCIIAVPVAWFYLRHWLQQYEYRTAISLWIFGAAISGALLITIITVSFQAIKAATANPVKALRSE